MEARIDRRVHSATHATTKKISTPKAQSANVLEWAHSTIIIPHATSSYFEIICDLHSSRTLASWLKPHLRTAAALALQYEDTNNDESPTTEFTPLSWVLIPQRVRPLLAGTQCWLHLQSSDWIASCWESLGYAIRWNHSSGRWSIYHGLRVLMTRVWKRCNGLAELNLSILLFRCPGVNVMVTSNRRGRSAFLHGGMYTWSPLSTIANAVYEPLSDSSRLTFAVRCYLNNFFDDFASESSPGVSPS